jgi:Bifunctional DNA primase/polymerase, N-terminal
MTDSLTAMVTALGLGLQGYACFPCQDDKKPFPGSSGFKDAIASYDSIRRLWRKWPGPLVGVACGKPSGITVLDVDAKHTEAVAWLTKNRGVLLPARVHRTRSGGWHLIYAYAPGVKNSASKIHKGVDVRGEGGYIIWWPTTGCVVEIDIEREQLSVWPSMLVAADEPLPAPPDPNRVMGRLSPGRLKEKAIGLVQFVLEASEGERNARLYWAACRVRDMDADGVFCVGLTRDDLLDALHQAALSIGLKAKETRLTLRSALRGRRAA